MQLRLLGKGLSKHKWAVDRGRGRFGSLLKHGRSWEERPRLNGIQYGTQPVTCNAEDNGSAVAYMILKRSHTKTLVSLTPQTGTHSLGDVGCVSGSAEPHEEWAGKSCRSGINKTLYLKHLQGYREGIGRPILSFCPIET